MYQRHLLHEETEGGTRPARVLFVFQIVHLGGT